MLYMSKNVKLKHTYKISFKNTRTGDIENLSLDNIDNKTESYDKARELLLDKYKQSIQTFESEWELDDCKHYIGFKNKPWENMSDLEKDLKSISGVKKVVDYPKGMQYYGPPVLRVVTKSSSDRDTIKKSILNYFHGLQVEKGGDNLYVTIDPFKFK